VTGRPSRLRVVRFHLGEQEAALPADAVMDVDEPRAEHPHVAAILGETAREDDAAARTLVLRCPRAGARPVLVDGPVQFGHLEAGSLVEIPARLRATLGELVVGLWRTTGDQDGRLGWRLSLEALCARMAHASGGVPERAPSTRGEAGEASATVID